VEIAGIIRRWSVFRSLKTEWIPSTGYATTVEASRDISYYLMQRYNQIRPYQLNGGLAPAVAEEKLNPVSGVSDHYTDPVLTSEVSASFSRAAFVSAYDFTPPPFSF
jgi:hypothetical protein